MPLLSSPRTGSSRAERCPHGTDQNVAHRSKAPSNGVGCHRSSQEHFRARWQGDACATTAQGRRPGPRASLHAPARPRSLPRCPVCSFGCASRRLGGGLLVHRSGRSSLCRSLLCVRSHFAQSRGAIGPSGFQALRSDDAGSSIGPAAIGLTPPASRPWRAMTPAAYPLLPARRGVEPSRKPADGGATCAWDAQRRMPHRAARALFGASSLAKGVPNGSGSAAQSPQSWRAFDSQFAFPPSGIIGALCMLAAGRRPPGVTSNALES